MSVTPVRVKALPAVTVVRISPVSPFLPGSQCAIVPPAAAGATVYRVDAPGTSDAKRFGTFRGDGSTTVFDMTKYCPGLNAMDSTLLTSAIDATNILLVVVTVDGVPLVREGVDADADVDAVTAACFNVTGAAEITFGSTYTKQNVICVYVFAASDITNSGAIAAQVETAETLRSFYAATAACSLVVQAH